MSSSPAAALPVTTLDEDAWEDLLSFIEEHREVQLWRELIRQEQQAASSR